MFQLFGHRRTRQEEALEHIIDLLNNPQNHEDVPPEMRYVARNHLGVFYLKLRSAKNLPLLVMGLFIGMALMDVLTRHSVTEPVRTLSLLSIFGSMTNISYNHYRHGMAGGSASHLTFIAGVFLGGLSEAMRLMNANNRESAGLSMHTPMR